MTKDKEKKVGKDQLLLEASRVGNRQQLDLILGQMQQIKSRKKTNPLASLRKTIGPNSIRDPVTGFTCLHHASLNGHSECVKLILDYGAKANAVDYKGSSALHLAAWAGNLDVVRILLSHSQAIANQSPARGGLERQENESSSRQSPGGSSKQQVEIDLCNNDNQTPLSLAAQFGHTQVVAELLAHGANVHSRNNQLESPLDLACLNGRLETVDLLLSSSPVLVAELKRDRSTIPANSGLFRTLVLAGQNTEDAIESAQATGHSSPQSARRSISAGWSTLLRGAGRRESTSQSTATAAPTPALQQSNNQQSPLQRFTVASLSMRGPKSSPTNGNRASSGQEATTLSAIGRRATLAASNQQTASARPMIGRQLLKQISTEADYYHNQDQHQHQQLESSERLLDHSPLHYAVRRGHAMVVHLLLGAYNANLLQVTALGSVLHEIALNNGKHSEMISLLFGYLTTASNADKYQQVEAATLIRLDKFLNLKNVQQKSVFEVLNEINNRSAQEMKRLIYESSEQIHSQLTCESTSNSFIGSQKQPQTGNQQMMRQGNQTNTFTSSPAASPLQLATLTNPSQQQQQFIQQQPFQIQSNSNFSAIDSCEQQKQFSDIHQINSFVTMKRAPKRNGATSANCAPTNNFHINSNQQPYSTQTIDRRTHNNKTGNDARLRQIQQHQQQAYETQQQQQQFAAMTRSVSNLYRCPTSGPQDMMSANQSVDWMQTGASEWQNQDAGGTNRKRRSKSRDLGSLLMEAKQQQQLQQHSLPQQAAYQAANAPQLQQQLVRSQTDCSHLMGRLFGEQVSSYSLGGPPLSNKPTQSELHQQHSATGQVDWTKTINRHYHVYDQEFYPPRLLSAGPPVQAPPRPMVAVVPPLGRHQAAESVGSTHLRASTRSTASSVGGNAQNRWPGPHSADVPTHFVPMNSQISGADSRLSLNLEAQQQQMYQQQQYQPQQQHNPMDRFLGRHSRKVQQELQQQSPPGQKRQDLLELQRRLAVECNSHKVDQSQQQQQQQPSAMSSIPSSYSLESHLSESHLFETTRKALMEDFDKMIGQELLSNKKERAVDRLMGVSLDMDSRGERLTVSGTRLTMPPPPPPPPPSTSAHSRSGSNRSLASHSSGRSNTTKPTLDCQSMSSNEVGSTKLVGSPRSNSSIDPLEIPPPKPPRLSLLGKQKTCPSQRSLGSQSRKSVIYDLPSAPSSAGSSATGSHSSQPLSAQQRAKSQQISSSATTRNAPLTEPPRERPPPPPSQSASPRDPATLARPLHVYPPSEQVPPTGGLQVAASSSGSSTSSGTKIMDDQQHSINGGLLKLASSSAPQASNSMRSGDADSGVGTSNSPASTGHDDSEEMDASLMVNPLAKLNLQSRQSTGGETTAPAVVRHFVRVAQRPPVRPPLPSGYCQMRQEFDEHASDEAPPSPKTAQLYIEEALMPLAKTTDVANQTNNATHHESSSTTSSNRLAPSYSSNDLVDRWLVHDADTNPGAADYENCRQLQRRLRDARCRSIGNLLNDCTFESPLARTSSLDEQDEDEDYAAESASSTTTTTTSGLCPGDVSNSGSPLSVAKEDDDDDDSSGQQLEQSSIDNSRKELTIKIMIDANDGAESGDGDEVFYVNPLELKKIAMKRSQTDAETLTDEELCAAVDKDSGFIRFTLRKRRNQGGNSSLETVQRQQQQVAPTQVLDQDGSASKRTKLNESAIESNTRATICDQSENNVDSDSVLSRNGMAIQDLNNNTKEQITETEAEPKPESISTPQEQGVVVTSPHVDDVTTMQKQTSIESSASEVEMDTSQVSTSSSSKDSIKSIVSQTVEVSESLLGESKGTGPGELNDAREELSHRPVVEMKKEEPKQRRVSLPTTAKPCGTLVSEVAKRLEAAATNDSSCIKPVAAARRINNRPMSTYIPSTGTNPSDLLQPAEQQLQQQHSPGKKGAVPGNFVPVKSVCWPPKNSNSVRNSVELSLAPISKRWPHTQTNTSTNKSSSEQVQDENRAPANVNNSKEVVQKLQPPIANANATTTTNKTRPKPAPPAKPAKLAATIGQHL